MSHEDRPTAREPQRIPPAAWSLWGKHPVPDTPTEPEDEEDNRDDRR